MCLVKHVVEKCSIVCSCACKGSRFSLCRHSMPIHIQCHNKDILPWPFASSCFGGGERSRLPNFSLSHNKLSNEINHLLLFQAQIFTFMRTHLSLKSKDSRMSARLASLCAFRQWFDPSFCYCRLLYMTTCFGPVSFPSLRMILVSEPAGSLHSLFGKRGEEGRREQEQMHVKGNGDWKMGHREIDIWETAGVFIWQGFGVPIWSLFLLFGEGEDCAVRCSSAACQLHQHPQRDSVTLHPRDTLQNQEHTQYSCYHYQSVAWNQHKWGVVDLYHKEETVFFIICLWFMNFTIKLTKLSQDS